MSKKIYITVIILLILLFGLTVASATDNTTKNTQATDIQKNTHTTESPSIKIDNTNINKKNNSQKAEKEGKSINKIEKNNMKRAPDLMDCQVSTENITCNEGDIVRITVTTTPEEVNNGILTWFIDGQVIGIHNITYDPKYIDYDTTGRRPGVYEIYVDFGVSEDYLEAACTSTLTINRILKNVSFTTQENVTADMGESVEIPFVFNDTVNDGKVSISYGGSVDNTVNVRNNVNSIIFDTTDYLPGEYDLELSFYDSSYFNANTTHTILYLYQPTTLTADKEELNIMLGEENSYQIDFETSLDSWDEVIWASIDIYIDNKIIDTLIIDDTTGNHATLVLDDYNLQDLTPGEHTLRAVFTSDDPYTKNSTTNVTLNVAGDVELELPENITVMTSDSIVIPVNATFNHKTLTSGVLTYYINNNMVGTLDLSTGNKQITLANNYNPGTHNIRVDYQDNNGIYTSTSNTTSLIVRSTSLLETSVLNNTIRNTTFSVSLKDARGNGITGLVNITLPDGTKRENVQVTDGTSTLTFENMNVGSNTFTIEYPGNDYYNPITDTLTVDVVKLNSSTTASVTNSSVRNTTVRVSVMDEKTGLAVTSGDVEIINTDDNRVIGTGRLDNTGTVTITTTLEVQGDYNLRVDYKGNDKYNTSSTLLDTISVTVRASQTIVTINNDTYGNTSIIVTVKDPVTDTGLVNAPIVVTLPDGAKINTNTGSTGSIVIPLDLPVGANNVLVEFSGNQEYNTSTSTQNIEVTKRKTTTNTVVTNSSVRNTTINVTVTDKTTGNPVTSGTINIIDTNTDNIVGSGTLDEKNNILILTTITDQGTYDLRVEYSGNTNYTGSTYNLDDITVTGRLSTIEHSIGNTTHGNTSINITLKDPVTNTPITGEAVTITYPNGTTETLTTDPNGNITIKPSLPVGENTITVTYPGNEEYNTTTTTIPLTVAMRESQTRAELINNTIRNTTIKVTVTDKTTGTPVTSGDVEIINTANNEIVGRGTLNGENTITIPANIQASRTINLQINYKGNTNYTPSYDTIDNIEITKREATIKINTINNTVDDTRVNITLSDPITNTPITDAPITITLANGDIINTHTGSTGTINVILPLNAGENKITVTYNGNTEYTATTREYNITVDKLVSKITTNKVNTYLGETITLNATITDKEDNPISGGRVAFKINDVTIKDNNGEVIYATVTGGKASITYTIPYTYVAKTYKISAVYSGNNQFLDSRSNTPLLNIKQRQARLTLTNNPETQVNHDNTFHVTITDKQEPHRIVNGYVLFKIDGKTLTQANGETILASINNNQATLTYNIESQYSARKHTITTVLVNDSYARSQANNTFNVTKSNTQINLNTAQLNNKQMTLTGTITDNTGQTLNGINKVAVKVNGKTLTQANGERQYYYITDGKINITVDDVNLGSGEHTISVVTGERTAYTEARSNTTLTNNNIIKTSKEEAKTSTITTKQPVNIIPDKQIAQVGETNTITVKVQDADNRNIQKGSITFTSNGKTLATSTIKNGKATLNHKYTKAGTYTINATYNDPTETYTKTSRQITIQIIENPRETVQIIANNVNTTVGETLTYTSLYLDNHKNKIQTGTATITLNNKSTTHKITNGMTITPITLNQAGTYPITITYKEAKITRTITVNKKTPQITINKPLITAGKENTITATITTQTGVPLNEGKIQWKINGITLKNSKGKAIQTEITDGTSNIKYNIPTTWAGKQLNITSIYTGSNNHKTKKTSTTTNIPKLTAQATITITPSTPQTKDNTTIQIKILDKNTQKQVTGTTKIAIKLNGKTIQTPRITNGQYTFKHKLPLLKCNNTQKITVVYTSKNYKRLDVHKTFKIQKINTTITLKETLTIKKGKTLQITTTIKDTHNEVMKRNDTYCIKLNGKTIHKSRLNNGKINIQLTINYKAMKTYQLTIKTGDNHYYKGTNKTVKLKITN